MEIKDKIAWITGASSGMGAAMARSFAENGARVILLARNKEALDAVAADSRSMGGQADVYPVDLSDSNAVNETATRIESEVGIPDIIVNNASSRRWLYINETSNEDTVKTMAVPYFVAFYVTKAFYPEFVKRNSGHIVNTPPGLRGGSPDLSLLSIRDAGDCRDP